VPNRISAYCPTASARAQLFLAALAWTAVGTMLLSFGIHWFVGMDVIYVSVALTISAALGTIKAGTAMRKAARRAIGRIRLREGKCLGGFFSWQMWLFALGMMGMGQVLRHSSIPRHLLGVIYSAVGVALLLGSLFIWRAYLGPRGAEAS
jgi:hypothetical protein